MAYCHLQRQSLLTQGWLAAQPVIIFFKSPFAEFYSLYLTLRLEQNGSGVISVMP